MIGTIPSIKTKGIVCNDLCSHNTLLIMDITVGTFYWHTINFYNDMDDPSSLHALMDLDLDSMKPTLLVGDFNLHSHSWSNPTEPFQFTCVPRNVFWIVAAKFSQTKSRVLSHTPPSPLCVGMPSTERRVKVWVASHSLTQSALWEGAQSVGDHALIHTIASIPLKVKYRKEGYTNHFNMNISVDEWKSGQVYFDNSSPL